MIISISVISSGIWSIRNGLILAYKRYKHRNIKSPQVGQVWAKYSWFESNNHTWKIISLNSSITMIEEFGGITHQSNIGLEEWRMLTESEHLFLIDNKYENHFFGEYRE